CGPWRSKLCRVAVVLFRGRRLIGVPAAALFHFGAQALTFLGSHIFPAVAPMPAPAARSVRVPAVAAATKAAEPAPAETQQRERLEARPFQLLSDEYLALLARQLGQRRLDSRQQQLADRHRLGPLVR